MASHVFLTAKPADRGIVGREGALLEDGPPEEVGRRHRDLHPRLVERAPEPLEDGLPLRGRRAVGHEVVVVEAHAVGAELGEAVHASRPGSRSAAHLGAERVAPRVADRPQPEGEVVLGTWRVVIASWSPPVVGRTGGRSTGSERHRCPQAGPDDSVIRPDTSPGVGRFDARGAGPSAANVAEGHGRQGR